MIFCWNISERDVLLAICITNKVIANANVLCSLILCRFFDDCECALIVGEKCRNRDINA